MISREPRPRSLSRVCEVSSAQPQADGIALSSQLPIAINSQRHNERCSAASNVAFGRIGEARGQQGTKCGQRGQYSVSDKRQRLDLPICPTATAVIVQFPGPRRPDRYHKHEEQEDNYATSSPRKNTRSE